MDLMERLKRIFKRLSAGMPASARGPALRRLVRLVRAESERRKVPVEVILQELEASMRSPRSRRRRRALHLWRTLTPREQQIALLARRGYTYSRIGHVLAISPMTVKTHMRSILKKWGVPNKEALRRALADLPERRSLSKRKGNGGKALS